MNPKPRVKPILVNFPQRSEEWRMARLGAVTGSAAQKTFLGEASDIARNAAIRQILEVGQLSAKVKTTPEFLELYAMDSAQLFELAGIPYPEPAARIMYRRLKVAERLTGMDADPDGTFITHD